MRRVVIVLLLVLLVLFALSNTRSVRVGLWPLDFVMELPLSVAVLAGAALGFLAGGLTVWFGAWGQRRRAREAEHKARLLESQMAGLRAGSRVGEPR